MRTLLEKFYKTDISVEKFHYRKVFLEEPIYDLDVSNKSKTILSAKSYQINGITQSGKTKLLKNYLLSLKKNSYLYIDCSDVRIEIDKLNKTLANFCVENKIETLVLDNYTDAIEFVTVSQLLIASQNHFPIDSLESIWLYPLDYEEFLAHEHKYDSTALNHFFELGGFASMHKIYSDERTLYIQKTLQYALDEIEFDILCFCAKMMSQKISPFTIYERLKNSRKISKDKLYKSYENLVEKKYIHLLEKFNYPKATKKIYLCDISLRNALTIEKHFGRLFENMIYLELLKSNQICFYADLIDFYLPHAEEVILCMPFADERALFKKIEQIEAFLFSYQIKKITAITMNREGQVSHPLSKVELIPFDIWALGD